MIGASRYWNERMWAPRYWPKAGEVSASLPANIIEATVTATSQARSVTSGLSARTTTATSQARSVTFSG